MADTHKSIGQALGMIKTKPARGRRGQRKARLHACGWGPGNAGLRYTPAIAHIKVIRKDLENKHTGWKHDFMTVFSAAPCHTLT